MTTPELAGFEQLLTRRVGLRIDAATRARLKRLLAARTETGADAATFLERLERDATLLQHVIDDVTVQETSFFRDPATFEILARDILPGLRRPVTIWSAACANGQEPYTLAMTLEESGIGDWHVIATDVSSRALGRTRAAVYSDRELKGLSAERRRRHLVQSPKGWEIASPLRRRVSVGKHNLVLDPPPFPRGSCPIVLCRNVLIYLTHEQTCTFLERLQRWLPEGAYLLVGASESLWQVTDRFLPLRIGDTYVYRRADAPGATGPGRDVPRSRRNPTSGPVARRAPRRSSRGEERQRPPSAVDLITAGESAMSMGEHADAVTSFRKAAYLEPDNPIAHFYLGLALEAAGTSGAATRAFMAARAALGRGGAAALEAALEGYRPDELALVLDRRLTP